MLDGTSKITLSIDGNEVRVLAFTLEEALNEVGSLTCTLDGSETALDSLDSYLAKPVIFQVEDPETRTSRYFHGEVSAIETTGTDAGAALMVVTVVPLLHRLKYASHDRTFFDQTYDQIVRDVVAPAGTGLELQWNCAQESEQVHYCAQYEESDFLFFVRLLAREGLSYFIEHEESNAKLRIFEELTSLRDEDPIVLTYQGTGEVGAALRPITHLEMVSRVTPNKASTIGYDPLRPSLKIEEQSEIDGSGVNEVYCPIKSHPSPERAKKKADILVNSYLKRKSSILAETPEIFLKPGMRITVEGHPYESVNHTYVLQTVALNGSRPHQFSTTDALRSFQGCHFTAVPEESKWAPDQDYQKPIMGGVQMATTTGASGEEIHVDEHGQVTVYFHWDQRGVTTEQSSRVIRTTQLPTGGSMLLPRVGWEVMVAFHEGDVEEPLVTSRLYNGATMPPYKLPDNALRSSLQTATSPGDGSSNEIRMSDTKGDEQMFFNASKDMSIDVGNNCTQSIGNDHGVTIGANQKIVVIDSFKCTVGSNQSTTVSGNRKRSVATQAVEDVGGDHSSSIGGNLTQMIGGDHRKTVDSSSSLEIGGSSMTAAIGSVSLDLGGDLTHDVGAALIQVSKGARSVAVGGAKSERTGGAKIILAKGALSVEAASVNTTVGGAVIIQTKGGLSSSAGTTWGETAAGVQKAEAANITVEAENMLTLTMGGASVAITAGSITITGANVTVDGDLIQTSPMNLNN